LFYINKFIQENMNKKIVWPAFETDAPILTTVCMNKRRKSLNKVDCCLQCQDDLILSVVSLKKFMPKPITEMLPTIRKSCIKYSFSLQGQSFYGTMVLFVCCGRHIITLWISGQRNPTTNTESGHLYNKSYWCDKTIT